MGCGPSQTPAWVFPIFPTLRDEYFTGVWHSDPRPIFGAFVWPAELAVLGHARDP